MELIAASRIVRAQQRMHGGRPYAGRSRRRSKLSVSRSLEHHAPADDRRREPDQGSCLDLTSDRGSGRRIQRQRATRGAGTERSASPNAASRPCRYVVGRKGSAVLPVPRTGRSPPNWTGFSDSPAYADATRDHRGAARGSSERPERQGGVDEIHVVYTEFVSMLTQRRSSTGCCRSTIEPRSTETAPSRAAADLRVRAGGRAACSTRCCRCYIESRIFPALLDSAATESAATAAGDEVGDRQRQRTDREAHPGWPTRPGRPRSPRKSARSSAAPTRSPIDRE